MKSIRTTVTIDSKPLDVWHHLVDFPAHQDWNPFFASIEGQAIVGTPLTVVARNNNVKEGESSNGMTFKPTVLVADEGRELRWLGKLAFGGLFDGEHFFVLTDNGDSTTTLEHGEKFRGILIPFLGKVLRETEVGFERFNRALKQRVESGLRSGNES